MRAMAAAFVLVLSTASTAGAVPELHVAASVSAEHTSVEKGDGAPAGWGPRWELSAGLGLAGWISLYGVAASSSYSDTQLLCRVNDRRYDIQVTDTWLGWRLLMHPGNLVFFGVGRMSIHTTENGGLGSDAFDNTAWEIVFGGNLLRTPYANVQAQFTLGSYDRFDNLEHVHFFSLGLGVQL
jgi:outer membrane protein with beta-barrel domain